MKKPTTTRLQTCAVTGDTTMVPSYSTSAEYHQAYEGWAASKKSPDLVLSILCADGSSEDEFEVFQRMSEPCPYSIPWETQQFIIEVDTENFDASFLAVFVPEYDDDIGVNVKALELAMARYMETVDTGIVTYKLEGCKL